VQQLNDAYASGGYAGVIETGAAIAQTMAETLRDNSDTIWQAAADWCSGIAQAVSNALPALRSTAQSLGGTLSSVVANLAAAFPALGSAISVASTAMSGLNAVIAANPIGFILTAVFALVSALVGLSKTNTTVGKAIKSVWEGLKSVLDVNIKKVSNVAFDLLDAWQNRGSSAETEAATDDAVQAIEANTEAVLGAKKTLDEMIAEANSLILSDNMALADTVAASGTASVAAAATSYNSRSTIITQNIYSKAQTAADLARETRWEYTRAALAGY
jgi:hypothetical protein